MSDKNAQSEPTARAITRRAVAAGIARVPT